MLVLAPLARQTFHSRDTLEDQAQKVASSPSSRIREHSVVLQVFCLGAHATPVLTLPQSRRTWHRLSIPSKIHVLSTGMYCLVTTLIISWATMPPITAEILCNSPPAARDTSSAAFFTLSLTMAAGTRWLTDARISSRVAVVLCDVAVRAR